MIIGAGKAEHLGGYIEGGDPRTWCPEVWERLIQDGVKSVLDVGCGEGQAVKWFLDRGILAVGIEGLPQPAPYIIQHDFSRGSFLPTSTFSLVWCCEFLEHVDECYQQNYMPALTSAHRVACTAARPGQGGHHHVNLRPREYWISLFERWGFRYNQALTEECRGLVAGRKNYFNENGMIFDADDVC